MSITILEDMQPKYKQIVQVEVAHDGLRFVPTVDTAQLLQRDKLLMRKNANGFSLYGAATNLPEWLEFRIVSHDPDFWSFTDTPTADWYFSKDGRHYLRLRCADERLCIAFQTRATRWVYHIISALPLDNPVIAGFDGPEEVILPNGQTVLRFISATVLTRTLHVSLVAGTLTMTLPIPLAGRSVPVTVCL